MPVRHRGGARGGKGPDLHRHFSGGFSASRGFSAFGKRLAAGHGGRGLRPSPRRSSGGGAGPRLPRCQPPLPWRRAPPPRPAGRVRETSRRADGGGVGCALPPSRPAPPAGCRHLHPRGLHPGRGRLPPGSQCRAPSEATGGDGPALRGPPGGDRAQCRDRASLRVLAGGAEIRVSRRDRPPPAGRPRGISNT